MRDDRQKWDAAPTEFASIEAEGLHILPVTPTRQTLVSGPRVLAQAVEQFGIAAGWSDPVSDDSYCLALRRDRVLVVDGPEMAEGWDEERFQAVSDATDAYTIFQIEGPGAMPLLKRGTEISLDRPSRSVACLLFGFGALLYRHGAEDHFRLHVARCDAHAMWQNLRVHAETERSL